MRLQKNVTFSQKNKDVFDDLNKLPPKVASNEWCDAWRFYKKYKDIIPELLIEVRGIRNDIQGMSLTPIEQQTPSSVMIDPTIYNMIADEDD